MLLLTRYLLLRHANTFPKDTTRAKSESTTRSIGFQFLFSVLRITRKLTTLLPPPRTHRSQRRRSSANRTSASRTRGRTSRARRSPCGATAGWLRSQSGMTSTQASALFAILFPALTVLFYCYIQRTIPSFAQSISISRGCHLRRGLKSTAGARSTGSTTTSFCCLA